MTVTYSSRSYWEGGVADLEGGSVHYKPSCTFLEVRKAVTIKITVFYDIISCSLVDMYQHFGGICCVRLQSRTITFLT